MIRVYNNIIIHSGLCTTAAVFALATSARFAPTSRKMTFRRPSRRGAKWSGDVTTSNKNKNRWTMEARAGPERRTRPTSNAARRLSPARAKRINSDFTRDYNEGCRV